MNRKKLNPFHRFAILFMCISLILSPPELRFIARSLYLDEAELSAEADISDDEGFVGEYGGNIVTEDNGISTAVIGADGIRVAVSFTEEAGIPEGAEVFLQEIEAYTQEYADYFEESSAVLNQNLTDDSEMQIALQYARFFDLSFRYEGEEIEPDSAVSVEITYDRPELDYDPSEIMSDVIHFAQEQTVLMEAALDRDVTIAESAEAPEELSTEETSAISDVMRFETGSFSAYGLLFYKVEDRNIGDLLDGMTFALLKWEKRETDTSSRTAAPALMASYKQQSRLDLQVVNVYPKSAIDSETEDFTHYVVTDTDISEWTFTWDRGQQVLHHCAGRRCDKISVDIQ